MAFAVNTESIACSHDTLMLFFSSNFGASTNEARSPSPQVAPVEASVKFSSARAGRDSPSSASAIDAAPHPSADWNCRLVISLVIEASLLPGRSALDRRVASQQFLYRRADQRVMPG
jgi:hypothetical protein